MKYIGIDYGKKRVGVAVSDDMGILAFPRSVFENSPLLMEKFTNLIQQEAIDVAVLGESTNYQGDPNAIMKDITVFREQLEMETGLRVVLEPEMLTSRQAMHIQGDNDMNDASAAAIILQSYLDRMNGPRDIDDEELA